MDCEIRFHLKWGWWTLEMRGLFSVRHRRGEVIPFMSVAPSHQAFIRSLDQLHNIPARTRRPRREQQLYFLSEGHLTSDLWYEISYYFSPLTPARPPCQLPPSPFCNLTRCSSAEWLRADRAWCVTRHQGLPTVHAVSAIICFKQMLFVLKRVCPVILYLIKTRKSFSHWPCMTDRN